MSYRFKLNSNVPIYFKANMFICDNYEYMRGYKTKALIQINPDGACYYDINKGQTRLENTEYYKSVVEYFKDLSKINPKHPKEKFEFDEIDVLMTSIVYAANADMRSADFLNKISEKVMLEIKCYTDKRFKGKSKTLAEYLLPEYANKEEKEEKEEEKEEDNKEENEDKQGNTMNKTIKTIQTTVVESETTLPQEHYTATGEAVVNALLGQTLRVELVRPEDDEKETSDKIAQSVEKISYTEEDFNKEITLPDSITLSELEAVLKIKHFLLFTAPPGTGKTTAAIALANTILGEKESDRLTLMSFNQATEYSDIVSGLRQDKNGIWKNMNGTFKDVCTQAEKDKEQKYIIVLDEINRGNTLAALGEYLTAMSKIGEKIVCNTGETIVMPSNVYIVATMNTVDSSVTKLDAALRDRFAIVEMKATVFTVESIRGDREDTPDLKDAIKLVIDYINDVNKILIKDINRGNENQLGMRQLYTDYTTVKELVLVVKTCIKPQIDAMSINLDSRNIREIDDLTVELIKSLELLGESEENEFKF